MGYDPVGNMILYTDPESNATTFSFDELDRLISETNELGSSRLFSYDPVGNQTGSVDRNGRVREFGYDLRNRILSEEWFDDASTVVRMMTMSYDAAGQLLEASDPDSAYTYTYDERGRILSTSNLGTSGVPTVVLANTYDPHGNRIAVAETIDGAAAAVRAYTHDPLHRVIEITQSGPSATDKRVAFAYDAASQLTTVSRFSGLGGVTPEITSNYTFDLAGRLTTLDHDSGILSLANYSWTYDDANRIIEQVSVDGTSTYDYDDSDQITSADYTFQTDEAYTYDENGNRTNAGYVTGPNNRLTSDGTFNYSYDDEGNRISATEIATGNVTEYEWDHRNRLVRVTFKDNAGNETKVVEYTYDVFDRRIAKTVDADGDGPGEATIDRFVYDAEHIALQFDGAGDLTHRYLHGPAIDQLLADESPGGEFVWTLADHLGTIRDIADEAGNVLNHITYDSFGNVASQTDAAITTLFGYTGREFDSETGLSYYRARYYDSATGRFVSEDPLGFGAGDANLYRYVMNNSIAMVDPTGLESYSWSDFWDRLSSGYYFGTGYGEEAAMWYADIIVDPSSTWYEVGGSYVGLFFASLWTPDTWFDTTSVLTLSYGLRSAGAVWHLKDGSVAYTLIDYGNLFRIETHMIGKGAAHAMRWHVDALWGWIRHWPWGF